jgi:hypothetical protein
VTKSKIFLLEDKANGLTPLCALSYEKLRPGQRCEMTNPNLLCDLNRALPLLLAKVR